MMRFTFARRATMSAVIFLFALLLCGSSLAASSTAANPPRIIRYKQTVQYRNSTATVGAGHWSTYDGSIELQGNRSDVSDHDDSDVFQPIGYCMPFFGIESAEIHISSNGFLSPMKSAARLHFSNSNFNPPMYTFWGTAESPQGGDWPLLGLYVLDLDPTSAFKTPQSGIYVARLNKTYADGVKMDLAIVEYFQVKEYGDQSASNHLTAQIELWPNGTIIFRYKQVMNPVRSQRVEGGPNVGLIWSKSQRAVSPTPSFLAPETSSTTEPAVNIVAIRYDPEEDGCVSNFTTCEACSASAECVWCSSTSQCVPNDVRGEICLDADVRTVGLCGSNVYENRTAQNGDQVFYGTAITAGDNFTDIRVNINATQLFDGSDLTSASPFPNPINLSLGFSFPLFYNPPTKDPASPNLHQSLYVLGGGQLISPSISQPCIGIGSDDFYCQTEFYASALLPFGVRKGRATTGTFVHSLTLEGGRKRGDPFCSSVECKAGIVIQITDMARIADEQNDPETRQLLGFTLFQRFTYQVYLDEDGNIEFHYGRSYPENSSIFGSGAAADIYKALTIPVFPNNTRADCVEADTVQSPMFAYSPPLVGVYHNGLDGSQLRIPSQVIAAGKHVVARIAPVPGCDDCNGRGKCDYVNRVCICDGNFTGPTCEQCVNGTFGPSCAGCPDCLNGGRCLDGVDGGGTCACVSPYSGQNCEIECENAATMTAAELQCPGCNLLGGYCECGRCVCFRERGWSGSECEKWDDPCRRFSLDGCEVCLKYEPVQCQSCREHTCIARPGSFGIPANYTGFCTRTTIRDSVFCVAYKHPFTEDGSLTVIAIVVLFTAMAICTCVTVTVVCICRKRSPNPMVQNASVGAPDYDIPRREREIIQLHTLQRPKKGVAVQGIPLKVIPLKELHDQQQMMKAEGSRSSSSQSARVRHQPFFE